MNNSNSRTTKYPLLEAILAIQDLPLQSMYTTRDIAEIFKVCIRVIQNWISSGHLISRNLPGRWKFFPQDLEDFLLASRKSEC
jgi:phage terminase Nu1 subunit (DNA packaging protein)